MFVLVLLTISRGCPVNIPYSVENIARKGENCWLSRYLFVKQQMPTYCHIVESQCDLVGGQCDLDL